MSSSGSSSPSPEPELVPLKPKKKPKTSKKAAKKSAQPASVATPHGKNEGTNPDWAYKPPAGAVLFDHGVDAGDFDWDAVKADENLEVWVVRVPDGVKAKHLQGLKISPPSASKTAHVGSLERSHASYDVWSLGEDHGAVTGGEETKDLSCLLPRQSKGGKLYQSSRPVARHIVVSARPPVPTPDPSSKAAEAGSPQPVYHNPPRPRHSIELLKHRFMPLGALTPVGNADTPDSMDIDEVEELLGDTPDEQDSPVKQSQPKKSAPAKKRKIEGDTRTPKKAKKSKAAMS